MLKQSVTECTFTVFGYKNSFLNFNLTLPIFYSNAASDQAELKTANLKWARGKKKS